MHLGPRDLDKLVLHNAGFLAQKRLARGLKLNYSEAVALIATQLLELIRDGVDVADLMDRGRTILGRAQVLSGVAEMVDQVQVEGTFADGTKLFVDGRTVAAMDLLVPHSGELIGGRSQCPVPPGYGDPRLAFAHQAANGFVEIPAAKTDDPPEVGREVHVRRVLGEEVAGAHVGREHAFLDDAVASMAVLMLAHRQEPPTMSGVPPWLVRMKMSSTRSMS